MKAFDYERAANAQAAVALVAGRPGAAFLGGGTNLVDHMKLGIVSPDLLVDANAVCNATGIRVRDLPITPDKLLCRGL